MEPSGATLTTALDAFFARDPDRIILEAGDRQVSAGELMEQAAHWAGALANFGIGRGDRVAVQVEKSVEALLLYLGCLRLGAVYLPLNTAYRSAEIEYFLGDAQPRLFVCAPDRLDRSMPLAAGAGARIATLGIDGDGTLAQSAAEADPAPREELAPGDLAAVLYTSGTTGRSKGAMLSHANLLSNALALKETWGFTESDVLLHALPIFHVHGLFISLNTALLAGARMIWQPKFDAGAVIEALPRATAFMGVPTYYTRLLEDERLDRERTKHIRVFISGSAPLLPDTFAEFQARTGQRILERYGMTETGIIASNPLDGERRPGTVGMPLPGSEVRIVNAEGRPINPGETGMVEVRGPNVFSGYWKMPEKTRSEFRPDGFFITGDVATWDEKGYLRLVGRAKDLIICGGLNVYPKEIEELIDGFTGVRESAVVGLPHPDFGEAVAAIVHSENGAGLTADSIIFRLRDRIANFKVPKAVFFVEELPRNAMGKVQKNILRERYRGTFDIIRR
ncbi:MAG TPA: AMP-binding protein [Alphaproteobacteria bacterium]|nr:AMP-binding protein [Alphaproteobacteria bacterium]